MSGGIRRRSWPAFAIGVLLVLAQLLAACTGLPVRGSAEGGRPADGTIVVTVLDIGQGDAILIQTGTQNVLVDTGDLDQRDKLRAALTQAGVQQIDKIILTHPHADHIGGMGMLLDAYAVGAVYDNGMPSGSKIYLGYMRQLREKNVPRQGLTAGDVLDLGGGARFEVLAPSKELVQKGTVKGYKHDPNNECVVGRLVFGSFTMLFTGDAEKKEEKDILAAGGNVQSMVLKAGHHGSKTSSTADFLRAVRPETALISCGSDNDYGHPHKETMKKYRALRLNIYATPQNGTITVTSDGSGYEVTTERGEKL